MAIGLASEAPAAATPRLDPAFGTGGRVLTALDVGFPKYWFGARVHAAQTPDGRILVSANGLVLRYLPTGRQDRSFAQDGLLRIEETEGKPFELSDIAVDSQSRIVVAGSNGIGRIAVLRFTPEGAPDPSFGGGDGVVVTDFGLGALESPPATTAAVQVAGLAADSAGRIVVSGSTLRSQTSSCAEFGSFVGRLDTSGDVDTTFGNGGVATFDFSSRIEAEDVIVSDADAPLFLGGAGGTCRGGGGPSAAVNRLTTDGSPDPAFGGEGQVTLNGYPERIALDSSGRVLVLFSDTLLRLQPSGEIDSSFGHNGVARIPIRGRLSALRDLAIAPAGGVVTVGTQTHYVHRSERRRLVVARVGPQGKLDRRLGNGGILKLRFGRGSNTNGKQVLLDGDGHATVAGMVRNRQIATGAGLALYRLDLGP